VQAERAQVAQEAPVVARPEFTSAGGFARPASAVAGVFRFRNQLETRILLGCRSMDACA